MKQLFFTLLLVLAAGSSVFAQKCGHVNFGNLLSQMPDVKTAEAALQDYEKGEVAIGEKMVADFKAHYAEVERDVENMTPKALQAARQKLEKEQRAIQQFEQGLPRKIEVKRQELLGPIIKKAKDAVNAVAKARGYELVFDSSIFGNVLFAEDATDLLPAVKASLGIK